MLDHLSSDSYIDLTNSKNIVGCQGVVQLMGPDPGLNRDWPTKVGASKSFCLA